MEVYTLVHDESKDTTRNRIASESYLYPDGKTKEEVNVTYQTSKTGMETFSYTRKCFYPSGNLQYEESLGEKATEPRTVYYNEKGKKVKRPKQKFELFMQMPSFPGGQEALLYFLSQNVKYPPTAQENGIQGKVVVQFVVAKDGKIEEVEVLRSGGDPSLDREAVRIIKSMPRWEPGKRRGKPIRVKYTIPVNFRLM
ncbi:MAG: energy transducer TonB [Paludibacteraceae bacterium]|nr:energy transducer TonB [Paludibacteraceae bacterium]